MTGAVAFLVHIWLPVLATLAMAHALTQAFPAARPFPPGALTLGLGVLAVYTADRLLEAGRVPGALVRALWLLTALALAATVALGLWWPERLLPIDVGLGLGSLVYGLMKRAAVVKTALVTGTWWVGCVLLPYDVYGEAGAGVIALGALFHPASLGLALSVAAGALLCDLKDVSADGRAGVRSLPVLIGVRATRLVCALLSIAACALCLVGNAPALGLGALAMLLLCPWTALLSRPLLGPAVVDGALAAPGALLWVLRELG